MDLTTTSALLNELKIKFNDHVDDSYHIIIEPTKTPVGDLHLYVKRWKWGSFDIRWVRGSARGSIATYDGYRWNFHAVQSLRRGGDPARPLMNAVLLEGCGTEHHELQTRHRVKDHPFWKQFVRDVEVIFPVADVMLG